jgi:hypothetical protein
VALPAVLESAYLNRKTHSVASTTMAKHLTACLQHTAGETSVEVRLQGGGHLASKTSIVLIEARDKHVVCKHVLEGAKVRPVSVGSMLLSVTRLRWISRQATAFSK